jgi:hypothetical protein
MRIQFDQPDIAEQPYSPRPHRRSEGAEALPVSAPEAVTGRSFTVSAPEAVTDTAPEAVTDTAPEADTVLYRDSEVNSESISEYARESLSIDLKMDGENPENPENPEPPIVLYLDRRWPPLEPPWFKSNSRNRRILDIWKRYPDGEQFARDHKRFSGHDPSDRIWFDEYQRWHLRLLETSRANS